MAGASSVGSAAQGTQQHTAGCPVFRGSLVALVTPMSADGTLDYAAYKKLIHWHVEQGTDAIVAVGTTGESPTVSMAEHAQLIRVAVDECAGRIPVIAGVGGNSTSEAIELAQYARDAGAAAGLSVAPYYNKPTQEGLYQHFKTCAERVDLPLILYNVPGRTVADIANETVLRLAQIPNIIGLKDATGNIARGAQLLYGKPADFQVFSGDDSSAAALMLLGAQGNISVTANVVPRLMHDMCAAALAGDVAQTRALDARLQGLNQVLFVESNPIPVKWALAEMGLMQLGYRLPMVALGAQHHETVRRALKVSNLLN